MTRYDVFYTFDMTLSAIWNLVFHIFLAFLMLVRITKILTNSITWLSGSVLIRSTITKFACFIAWLSCLVNLPLWSMAPVPYSGKVAINTVNYHGNAEFSFSLHDVNGTTHWRNGALSAEEVKALYKLGH